MSLIADALEAAQREKNARGGNRTADPQGRDAAALRSVSRRTSRKTAFSPALAVVAVVALLLSAWVVWQRASGGPADALPSALAVQPVPPPLPLPTVDTTMAPAVDSTASVAAMDAVLDRAAANVGEEGTEELFEEPVEARPSRSRSSARTAGDAQPTERESPRADRTIPVSRGAVATPEAGAERKTGERGNVQVTVTRPEGVVDSLFREAVLAQRHGALPQAIVLYERAIGLAPDRVELLNNLGGVLRSQGDLARAEAVLRRAIAVDRSYPSAWVNLGIVLDRQGRRGEATSAFEQALQLDPGNGAARVNLAIQYRALGLLADARRTLEDAVRLDPSLAEGHYELARLLEQIGERELAARGYDAFLRTAGERFPPALLERVRVHLASLRSGARP